MGLRTKSFYTLDDNGKQVANCSSNTSMGDGWTEVVRYICSSDGKSLVWNEKFKGNEKTVSPWARHIRRTATMINICIWEWAQSYQTRSCWRFWIPRNSFVRALYSMQKQLIVGVHFCRDSNIYSQQDFFRQTPSSGQQNFMSKFSLIISLHFNNNVVNSSQCKC